jgi:polysaccharide pyruvyl transferase WcaK-like protein
VRIHLGHHFYGAGNLGDDFMLAGFLAAMQTLAPDASFSCSVPFDLEPLRSRFPTVNWLPYADAIRTGAIAESDVWLGLGGSPFQSAASRWFVDHLVSEAAACRAAGKPMYFLGVGVQTADELNLPEVRELCAGSAGIWTRDAASAERLSQLSSAPPIAAAADLAHIFFRETNVPPSHPGRITAVFNFDYKIWPGQTACLAAIRRMNCTEHVWLAQESRDLPGAEHALYRTLPQNEQTRWKLIVPDQPRTALATVMDRWPSSERLVTARYHSAIAGAWAGSKIVVLGTNEKLRAVARELGTPLVSPDADETAFTHALESAQPRTPPIHLADLAYGACLAFVRSAVAHRR